MLTPEFILHTLKTDCGYRQGDSILIGVSGGADSVALLYLLHAAKIQIAVAHVNYGLRGDESDGDEKFVSELCAKVNVPLYVKRTSRSELDSINNNLQAAARSFRYSFFEEIRLKESMTWIAVAHHSQDQLETVLINFLRGSGMNGMSGMKSVNGNIIRPLLSVDNKEVYAYLAKVNTGFRSDDTNNSDMYFRNRVRHHVLPFLMENDERLGKGWQHSVEQLAESSALLNQLLEIWADQVTSGNDRVEQYNLAAMNNFPQPHVLLNYMLRRRNVNIRFTKEQYADLLTKERGTMYRDGHTMLVYETSSLHLRHFRIPREAVLLDIDNPPEGWESRFIEYFDFSKEEKRTGYEALLDGDVMPWYMEVRKWKAGDRIYPLGLKGSKKVSDVLNEMKIPATEKEDYPVLAHENEIIWIPGYRIAERFKVHENTTEALHIKWNR